MVNSKYTVTSINAFIDKYFNLPEKVVLPEWEYEITGISKIESTLTDPTISSGKEVPFSCVCNVKRKDNVSKISTTVACVLGGTAEVTEYPNTVKYEMLPDVKSVTFHSIKEVNNTNRKSTD